MARSEQIRIDLEAHDDASRTLDDVADKAEALEDADVEIPVAADTSAAESALDDVEGQADALNRADVEIPVTADTSAAERGLGDVKDEAEALSREDVEIVLRAKIDAAKADLKSLRDGLEQTGDKADDTRRRMDDIGDAKGPGLQTNTISDLTGTLGGASGAAGDFGETFEAAGEIAAAVGDKVGLSADTIAKLSGVFGGLGIAVAAGAAAFTYFSEKQEAARRKQEELIDATRELNDAIEEGNNAAAAAQLVEMYSDAYDAARKAGVSAEDFTRFLTGATDELPNFTTNMDAAVGAIDRMTTGMPDNELRVNHMRKEWEGYRSEMVKARDGLDKTNGLLVKQDEQAREVEQALNKTAGQTNKLAREQEKAERQTERLNDAFNELRGGLDLERDILRFQQTMTEALDKTNEGAELTADEVLDIKQSILDVAEAAKLNPVQVKSLLEKVDEGDLATVLYTLQSEINKKPARKIPTEPKPPTSTSTDTMMRLAQDTINNKPPLLISTAYRNPAPGTLPRVGEVVPSMMPPAPEPAVNVTMVLPRGYRETDVITAGRRAARRSGGLYRRTRR